MEENKNNMKPAEESENKTEESENNADETGNKDGNEAPDVLYSDTDFMRERIKQRPINRKKLLRRTVITVVMAVVFGTVACVTFLMLTPVVTGLLNPETESVPETVTLPETPVEDEISPEDLISDGEESPSNGQQEGETSEAESMETAIGAYDFGTDEYAKMFSSLKSVAQDVSQSIVTVTVVESVTDWTESYLETGGERSGVIMADNGSELIVISTLSEDEYVLQNADDTRSIRITFNNRLTLEGGFLSLDEATGLCALTVEHALFEDFNEEDYPPVILANSQSSLIVGAPVIAVGYPAGISDSIVYGAITSNGASLSFADVNHTLLMTDMSAVSSGSGILINTDGEMLGIFSPSLTQEKSQETGGQIIAYGSSSVRSLIESLSNGKRRAYLGVYGSNVPDDIREENDMPSGAYISRVELDSPAMTGGIQPGDILTRIDDIEIVNYNALSNTLLTYDAGEQAHITLMRQGADSYQEVALYVTFE